MRAVFGVRMLQKEPRLDSVLLSTQRGDPNMLVPVIGRL
jgi:hypothetical protein